MRLGFAVLCTSVANISVLGAEGMSSANVNISKMPNAVLQVAFAVTPRLSSVCTCLQGQVLSCCTGSHLDKKHLVQAAFGLFLPDVMCLFRDEH